MSRITTNTFLRGSALALFFTLSVGAWAQARQVEVNRGIVTYASGNDLIVKTQDGGLIRLVVPDDYRLTVDGRQVAVRDLKPGTVLTQTITTTTEQQMVTNVRTVDAKVLQAKPPLLTLAMEDKIKHLRVPEGTRFTINGKEMTLADLREGMQVKGTVVTAVPTMVTSRTRSVSGQAPPPPKVTVTPTLIGVLLIEEVDVAEK